MNATNTNEQKHTPGPWSWQGTRCNPKLKAYLSGPDGLVTAACDGLDLSEANARLIASAPELLEALQACQRQLSEYVEYHQKRGGCSVEIESAEEQARAAIAKATGGNP